MIRVLFVAIAIALASCEPHPAGVPKAQRDVIYNAELTRVCPDGVSRIYTTRLGDRHLHTVTSYESTLTPIDPLASLKDIC